MTSGISLYFRLAGLLVVLLALLGIVAFWYADHRSDKLAQRNVDNQLLSNAALVLSTASARRDGPYLAQKPETTQDPARNDRAVTPAFEVSDSEGTILALSPDFPATVGQTGDGFSDRFIGTTGWRILTLRDDALGLTTRLATSMENTELLATDARTEILAPVIAVLVLLAIVVLAAIWIGLRPLRQIEAEIGRLDPIRMSRLDLDADRMPRELSRLVRTLDDLLDRLQKLMRHQQAFVSAAGHELRTPLAGCSTQLEVARRSREPAQRDKALDKLDQGLSRMGTLVEQLMIIARSEQSSLKERATVFSLGELLEDIRDTLSSQQHRVTLRTDAQPVRVSGHPDLIRSMVTNLVRNAFRASPASEPVEISLQATSDGALLKVCDRGHGMNPDQKSHVFDSFHSGSGGTGLGLAIANAVVKAHDGQIRIRDRQSSGLCIEVVLPTTPQ